MEKINLGCYKDLFEKADGDERSQASNWYPQANKIVMDISRKSGVTEEQVAGIIAVLSPLVEWSLNVKAAKVFIESRGRGRIPGFRKNREKALAILKKNDLSQVRGPKVFEFYNTLLNPKHPIPVIDSQMIQAFYSDARLEKNDVSMIGGTKRREPLQKAVVRLAEERSLPVSTVQAQIWLTWKRLKGPYANQLKLWK